METFSLSRVPVSADLSAKDASSSSKDGSFAAALALSSLDVGELTSSSTAGRIASALPALPASPNTRFVTPLPDMVRGEPMFQARPAAGVDLSTFIG
jgi:hypothetical protein